MSTFSLSPSQRLQIINILPQESGSLQESIQVKRLRDRIGFTEEEKETIEMDAQTGSFNPQKFADIANKDVDLGESEREILAGSFVKREDEGSVPTNDAFVELVVKLEDEIEEFRNNLD